MSRKLSIVTTCKNREEQLLVSIPSWLACPSVDKIIVVDFDSQTPLFEVMREKPSWTEKVTVIRVENQPTWKIGLAQNIGIGYVKGEYVLKIDSDIRIESIGRSFELLLQGNCYVRGMHRLGSSSGIVFFATEDFRRCGGYNDWITGWGGDDSDFYRRLSRVGRKAEFVRHNEFCEIKQQFSKKNENAKTLDTRLFDQHSQLASDPKFTALRNYVLCAVTSGVPYLKPRVAYSCYSGASYLTASLPDLEDKEAIVRPYIEFSNSLAISLYALGYVADDAYRNPLIDQVLQTFRYR